MNVLEFDCAIESVSLEAGLLGALTGLGGGVVIVLLLALWFGVDVRCAIGASLIAVVATSCGAAAACVKEGFTNLRIGMFRGIATTFGAVFGAFIAAKISTSTVAVIHLFLILLLMQFIPSLNRLPRWLPVYKLIWRDRFRRPPPDGAGAEPSSLPPDH